MENIFMTLIVLAGAGLLAYAVYLAVGLTQRRYAANPLADFLDEGPAGPAQTNWGEQVGNSLGRSLPLNLETWAKHLEWAQRGGKYTGYTTGRLIFTGLVMGAAGVILPLMNPALIYWAVPFIGFAVPFIWVRSAAEKVRRRTVRQLPELAALVAAELSANTPPEEALERASELPGTLSDLLKEAVRMASSQGRPLLSHEAQKGTLRDVFERTGVPAIRAFAVQLDMAAAKGVEVSERMVEISTTLAAEYKQQLLENIEKLETNLTTAVAAFYFVPMVLLILLPMFSEALKVI